MGLSLDGDGMSMAMWDGGWARKTHAEFNVDGTSKVTTADVASTTESDGHATHVAGTLVAKGAVSSAKGMAPKASLRSYNWTNDITEVITEAATNGLLFSNHSYGVPIYNDAGEMQVPNWFMGCYNDDAQDWDAVAVANPYYLMVTSAGNEGGSSYDGGIAPGLDKLTGEKNSKNNLVIANANPTVHPITGVISALPINSSSSQGPSDDGRIKPDLAGDGTNLFSSYNTDDTSYETLTGTSMASPNVAGSLLLLQQHYRNLYPTYMRSSTVKALVCHSALDDPETPGPDPRFGWGLLDAQAAATVISQSTTGQSLLLELTLESGQDYVYHFSSNSSDPIKATICWLDPTGNSQAGQLNSTTPALVNDLDLRISNSSETYFPWKLDLANLTDGAVKGDNIVDNVERVEVDEAATGDYTLTVSNKGSLNGGSQKFSLVLSGAGIVLGVDDHSMGEMGVWPNPAKNLVNIKLTNPIGKGTINMFDVSGRQVYSQNVTDNANLVYSVNTESLSRGVYFLKVNSGSQTYVKKVILE
ncbi:S8 family serine peptidase [Flavobacterium silvaticum]|uniref:S8 family serine peptidase n=1 Tax=Flavobacterium silvaticum TaxID=1852020 RepID=A0A972FRK8_9FLAO|nr:S8 family serine peptidase [Flavobacterium silvaticum]NMH26707.1 S8 family serine peptidase [Flavobacterium silvaticum]